MIYNHKTPQDEVIHYLKLRIENLTTENNKLKQLNYERKSKIR